MRNKHRLLTPGPTPIPEKVRLAMAADMIHHRKPEFKAIMHTVQEKTQVLFGTAQPVLPLACSGTGAMTAAIHTLFSPGEEVLVVEAGVFGSRWREIAEVHDVQVFSIMVPWGEAVGIGQIEKMLDAHPDIKAVLVQLCETSTGVMHPVKDIAALATARGILTIVDGISAVSISPCPMDEWGIDCLLTGSQKGLMLPPGLALVALSERAWKKAETVPLSCYYFNLRGEKENILKNQTLFTTPVSLIIGLGASLDLLLQSGMDTVYNKQWALACMARAGIKGLGLLPFAKDHYAWGLTSVCVPDTVDGTALLDHMVQNHGVIMAGGQAQLKGRIIRIGHMGWLDWADLAAGLYALASALKAQGHHAPTGWLEHALDAYEAALQNPAGSTEGA